MNYRIRYYEIPDTGNPHYVRLCKALGGKVVFVDTGVDTEDGQVSETGWIRGSDNCVWRNDATYHPIHGPKATKFYGGYPIVYPIRLAHLRRLCNLEESP